MKLRLFLTCWAVFALHFATNVVREHYPALALIERGDFKVDAYADLHTDIFKHRDGHYYIGNQVLCSALTAVPLLPFKPVLEGLVRPPEDRDPKQSRYETEYPMRAAFAREARRRGIDLKLGAATVVTSVLVMAPLGALLAVLLFQVMLGRGVERRRALWLALLFALGTPIFYRSAVLNHNVFLTAVVLGTFLLLRPVGGSVPSVRRRAWAGCLGGAAVAFDYAGVIPLLVFFAWLVLDQVRGSLAERVRAGLPYVLGSVPPVLFLLFSQWAMYGNAFLPGQHWMAEMNPYVEEGYRGLAAPDAEVFFLNLFSLDWGLFTFGPLLLLAFIPVLRRGERRVLNGGERCWTWIFVAAFLLFNACNQFSLLQWNTGFRYLLPLVPLLFLAAADHLRRLPRRALAAISVVCVLHEWVLCMFRYTPPEAGQPQAVPVSWERFLEEGVTFPWLNVLRSSNAVNVPLLDAAWLPYALLAALGAFLFVVWKAPFRRFEKEKAAASPAGAG